MTTATGPTDATNKTITRGDSLTPRERQVMDKLVLGMTNGEIAQSLGISVKSAEGHVRNIMVKAGLGRRVLLALWYVKEKP